MIRSARDFLGGWRLDELKKRSMFAETETNTTMRVSRVGFKKNGQRRRDNSYDISDVTLTRWMPSISVAQGNQQTQMGSVIVNTPDEDQHRKQYSRRKSSFEINSREESRKELIRGN